MREIVFFLEEPSAAAMLDGLLPRILPGSINYRCVVFEGKQDLEKQMLKRMRGYRVPGARFLVLRDQDASDCRVVKEGLLLKCIEAGHPDALVRIVCHELESWYLADLPAVEKGLGVTNLKRYSNRRPFVSPDALSSPAQILKKIAPSYQKVSGSRSIGPYLDPRNKRSRSFSVFIEGLERLFK